MSHRLHLCHLVLTVPDHEEGVKRWGEALGLGELPVAVASRSVYRKLGLNVWADAPAPGDGPFLLIQRAERWPDERYGDPAIHFDLETDKGKGPEAAARLESLGFRIARWESSERWPEPYPVLDDPTGMIRFCILDPPPYPDLLLHGAWFEWPPVEEGGR